MVDSRGIRRAFAERGWRTKASGVTFTATRRFEGPAEFAGLDPAVGIWFQKSRIDFVVTTSLHMLGLTAERNKLFRAAGLGALDFRDSMIVDVMESISGPFDFDPPVRLDVIGQGRDRLVGLRSDAPVDVAEAIEVLAEAAGLSYLNDLDALVAAGIRRSGNTFACLSLFLERVGRGAALEALVQRVRSYVREERDLLLLREFYSWVPEGEVEVVPAARPDRFARAVERGGRHRRQFRAEVSFVEAMDRVDRALRRFIPRGVAIEEALARYRFRVATPDGELAARVMFSPVESGGVRMLVEVFAGSDTTGGAAEEALDQVVTALGRQMLLHASSDADEPPLSNP